MPCIWETREAQNKAWFNIRLQEITVCPKVGTNQPLKIHSMNSHPEQRFIQIIHQNLTVRLFLLIVLSRLETIVMIHI